MNKVVKHVAAGFVVGLAAVWCGVASSAPPVNQTIGMFDQSSDTMTEADCRECHDSGVPDRHHLLTGDPICSGTLVPYPDADGDGVPDTVYGCLNCHDDDFTVVRDCTVCHSTSAHHMTQASLSGDCRSCHGHLVDNIWDGHYIPTYSPSLVTPSPSGGDGLPPNIRGNGAGACNYCHDDDGLPTPIILTNHQLHHGAANNCSWCHRMHGPVRIRVCEGCHGPDSLHNIQADSPASGNIGTLVVGGEQAGYGHVGRDAGPGDSDCWGCHGFSVSALAPFSGPIVPTIYNSDVAVIDAAAETVVTLTGSAFANTAGSTLFESKVALTAADGSSVILTPDAITQGQLVVTIPADTAAGNYNLQAVKTDSAGGPVASNPVSLTIRPQVVITDVSYDGTIATITGSGFSGYAPGSGTSVSADGTTATIVSWTDTKIVVQFDSIPGQVTVNSVFGSDTAEVSGPGADAWLVKVPFLGSEFSVTFEELGPFLIVRTSYAGGEPDGIALGMEFGKVIFWMDASGAIYFGNMNRDAGAASGIVFGDGIASSIWSAERAD